MPFEFLCSSCGQVHTGMPAFAAKAPVSYYAIPEAERASRCELGTDDCIIDGERFFILGCVEIPVHGEQEPFSWGVWVSLSRASYEQWRACFGIARRAHVGPFFGWLNAILEPYPTDENIKTRVHLRDDGIRPSIELEPTMFRLAVEQREGISRERAAELYERMMHPGEN
jgi:hypothetical protein